MKKLIKDDDDEIDPLNVPEDKIDPKELTDFTEDTFADEDELDKGEYYLNNKRLPRVDTQFNWSPEMLKEIAKSKDDIRYFSEKYFFITTLDEGKKRIKLFPYQKRILKALERNRFNIICASRQTGKTTLMTIFALWSTCFEKDKRVIIVANKEKTAIMILRRIQLAYQQLPNWFKPGIKQWGTTEIIFANDSSISISTTTGSAARGESVNILIIDEMAHIQQHLVDEFWASVVPVISSSKKTKIFAVSTPNGTGNMFYDIYSGAGQGGLFSWHKEQIDWWEYPGHDKKWARDQLALLGGDQQLFDQEFGNKFIETGETAVDKDVIENLKKSCCDPIFTFENDHYKIWKEPNPSHIYAIGVDVGEGVGEAASTAQVLDLTDLTNIEQVASYHDNLIDPSRFAYVLNRIANHWGCPPLLIERNNCGGELIAVLRDTHHYLNIVSYNRSSGMDTQESKDIRLGIVSHTNSKYNAVMNMRYWLNTLNAVRIHDLGTVHEIETFIRYPNGTWKKKGGKHVYDDRVCGLMWALFMLQEVIVERYFEICQYDNLGKPLIIKPYTVNAPEFFKLDKYYQSGIGGGPLPAFMDSRVDLDEGIQDLIHQGWQVYK